MQAPFKKLNQVLVVKIKQVEGSGYVWEKGDVGIKVIDRLYN
jgi:hypothetical protein